MAKRDKVVAVPDLHFPWAEYKKVYKVYDIIEDEQPSHIVQLGDAWDMYSQRRFAGSNDIMTPKEEMEEAQAAYFNFWKNVAKRSPKSKMYQLSGNHHDRVIKSAMNKAPELLPWLDVQSKFNCVKQFGVNVIMDSRHELEINGVLYIHGWLSKSFAHARYFNKPVVHGHLHSAGIHMENMKDSRLWSMNCGYLADPHQVPLVYRATKTEKWVHAIGMVDIYGPRLICL
jgi:UDP-2,3-diacylglucosamine pyrophosphatase LpxH